MQDLVNKTIVITGYRHTLRNRLAMVVKVRDTHVEPVSLSQYNRYKITRSRYLITVWDMTEGCFRSYYDKYMTYRKPGLFSALYQWWVTH